MGANSAITLHTQTQDCIRTVHQSRASSLLPPGGAYRDILFAPEPLQVLLTLLSPTHLQHLLSWQERGGAGRGAGEPTDATPAQPDCEVMVDLVLGVLDSLHFPFAQPQAGGRPSSPAPSGGGSEGVTRSLGGGRSSGGEDGELQKALAAGQGKYYQLLQEVGGNCGVAIRTEACRGCFRVFFPRAHPFY